MSSSTYFINVNVIQAKNRLDKRLQAMFLATFNLKLISTEHLPMFETNYSATHARYKLEGGLCKSTFDFRQYSDTIFITVGTTINILLTQIKGTVNEDDIIFYP